MGVVFHSRSAANRRGAAGAVFVIAGAESNLSHPEANEASVAERVSEILRPSLDAGLRTTIDRK